MEEFIRQVTDLLRQHFPDSDLEFERAGPQRIGGLLAWSGFTGVEQIARQRQVWQVLRAGLSPEDQLRISAVLTLTPEEMAAARAG
ncbi:MAG TPA: hypothetical protein VL371_23300 [Gemmataceae bacterium]|nr:hypothetical protein [Gemmataceae bacterium]